jgi:hypothetical protein
MTKPMRFIFLPILILVLVACQNVAPSVNKPTAPAPAAGKAVFTGQVLMQADGKPLPEGTPVRLAQVYRQGSDGAFVLDMSHSPSSLCKQDGFFTIVDIAPAEYLIVVGRPDEGNYIIHQGADGKAATFKVEANKTIDIGTIKVGYIP